MVDEDLGSNVQFEAFIVQPHMRCKKLQMAHSALSILGMSSALANHVPLSDQANVRCQATQSATLWKEQRIEVMRSPSVAMAGQAAPATSATIAD